MAETNNTFSKIKDLYSNPILEPNANESNQENLFEISNNNPPNLQNFIENGKEFTFVYDPRIKTNDGYGAYTIRPVENGLLTSDTNGPSDAAQKYQNWYKKTYGDLPVIKSDYTKIDALLKSLFANNSAPAPAPAAAAPALEAAPASEPSLVDGSAEEDKLRLQIDTRTEEEQIKALKLMLFGASAQAPAAPTSVVQGMFPEVEAMQRALY